MRFSLPCFLLISAFGPTLCTQIRNNNLIQLNHQPLVSNTNISVIYDTRNLRFKKLRKIVTKVAKVAVIAVKAGAKAGLMSTPAGLKIKMATAVAKRLVASRAGAILKKKLSIVKNRLSKNIAKRVSDAKGKLSKRVSDAKGKLSKRVSDAKGKLSKLSKRVSDAKGKLSKLSKRVSDAKGKLSKLSKRGSNFKSKLSKISKRVSDAKTKLSKISKRVSDAKTKISKISKTGRAKSRPVPAHSITTGGSDDNTKSLFPTNEPTDHPITNRVRPRKGPSVPTSSVRRSRPNSAVRPTLSHPFPTVEPISSITASPVQQTRPIEPRPARLRRQRPTTEPTSSITGSPVQQKRPIVMPVISTSRFTFQPTTFSPSFLPTTRSPSFRPTTFSPSFLPTTMSPSFRPTTVLPTFAHPTHQPTNRPTVTPTIQKITWGIFSSAPTMLSNIPPTRFPTRSLFLMEGTPTLIPYNGFVNSASPAARFTISPTRRTVNTPHPSSIPTALNSPIPTAITDLPTATNAPSFFPTLAPSAQVTLAPSSGANLLSSNGGSTASKSETNMNVVYVTVALIAMLICAGIFVFFNLHKKKTPTPFTKWSTHYDNRDTITTDRKTITNNEDIHHFYTKQSQPVFVPHVSKNNIVRKSIPNQRYSVAL